MASNSQTLPEDLRNTMSHLYLQPLCNLPGSRSPAGLRHTTLGSWLSSGQNQSSFQAQQAPWHHVCLCQPNTPCRKGAAGSNPQDGHPSLSLVRLLQASCKEAVQRQESPEKSPVSAKPAATLRPTSSLAEPANCNQTLAIGTSKQANSATKQGTLEHFFGLDQF